MTQFNYALLKISYTYILILHFIFLFVKMWKDFNKKTLSQGLISIITIKTTLVFDSLFDGDEPLWEPLEWSLIQTWIIFFFLFSWIGENLITSRFGSFTGRDKRVWYAWYKSMWWIEVFYIITLGIAILFIITPFYFELNYNNSYVVSFWNWFSKVFFFKSILIFNFLIILSLFIQINLRFIFYKKLLFLLFLIITVLFFLFFTQFYITFFSYFTDINWYIKNRNNSLIQLSHEPMKWSWDLENRDHFQYHNSKTVFWYKNDGPFAESFFFINLFYFTSLFIVIIFWLSLFKRVISISEFSYNYSLGTLSSLRQFYYFHLMLYLFILSTFIIFFLKFPNEFLWLLDKTKVFSHFRV